MWLFKRLKSFVSKHPVTVNILNSLKHCNTALPSHCFITLGKIESENIRLSVSEILGVFVSTLTAEEKYSLRNRNNLSQHIQLQWSKKEKNLSHFLLHM